MKYRVSVIQFEITLKAPEENRRKVKKIIESQDTENTDLIILPETWTTGFADEIFHNAEDYAESEGGKTLALIKELAEEYNVWFAAGTILENDGNEIYNTSFLINRKGKIAGKYRKNHLFSVEDEDTGIKPGNRNPVFQTELGPVALMTCYDIRFSELALNYAVKGAKTIIVVANFPKPRLNHWRVLLQARAIENQMYIIACNRSGKGYFGHSMIIDPWGDVLEEAGEEETILNATVDLNKVSQVRNEIPVYQDRHL